MIVEHGQAFLVGGLIMGRQTRGRNRVPYLQNLTLLRPLSLSEATCVQFDKILVYVTPTKVAPDTKQMLPEAGDLKRPASSNQ